MAAALTVDNASALFPSSIGYCIAVLVENSVRPGDTQPGSGYFRGDLPYPSISFTASDLVS